jgi:hypothetical protein
MITYETFKRIEEETKAENKKLTLNQVFNFGFGRMNGTKGI